MQARSANQSRSARAEIGSVLLCIVGGIVLLLALSAWTVACEAGSGLSCRNGTPSVELVIQAVLAVLAFAASVVVAYFVHRHAYASARVTLVLTMLLWATWVVLVDAVNNGWDDLRFRSILLTIALIVASLALIVAVLLKRTR